MEEYIVRHYASNTTGDRTTKGAQHSISRIFITHHHEDHSGNLAGYLLHLATHTRHSLTTAMQRCSASSHSPVPSRRLRHCPACSTAFMKNVSQVPSLYWVTSHAAHITAASCGAALRLTNTSKCLCLSRCKCCLLHKLHRCVPVIAHTGHSHRPFPRTAPTCSTPHLPAARACATAAHWG